jgi:ADP-heptose:LPS heptosyltransferase
MLKMLEGLPTRYLLVFPGAADAHKRWPFFGELLEKCLKKWSDYEVILAGAPSEFALAEGIVNALPAVLQSRIHNRCGHYALPEVPALVGQAKALLCNDSMSTHLGAMLNVPTFCLATGQHYGRFLPYPEGFAPNLHCFFPPEVEETPHAERYEKFQPAFGRPIEGISVERVFRGLRNVLEKK